MKFKAVLFDLDGTLANSLSDLAASTNYCLEKHGCPTWPEENFKYFAGDGIAKMLSRALPEDHSLEMLEQVKKDFMEYYSVHYADKTIAYDGLTALIKSLKFAGIKTAVVTNKAQEAAEKVVKKLYGDDFDIIMGLKPDMPPKPNPKIVFAATEQLGINPKECAFVGDTAMDIAVGVNSGAYPVGVLWGFRKREELEAAGAKAFAKNSEELMNILFGK